jgi:hypothetical protein
MRSAANARPGGRLRVGASDSTKPAVVAAYAREGRPVLVIVAKALRAATVEELGGLGEDAARASLYPERDTCPRARARTPGGGEARGHRSTWLGVGPIVVACIEAVAQRTLSPGRPHPRCHRWRSETKAARGASGTSSHPDSTSCRWSRRWPAARRGGIIDPFPLQAQSVRVEFFGLKSRASAPSTRHPAIAGPARQAVIGGVLVSPTRGRQTPAAESRLLGLPRRRRPTNSGRSAGLG